MCHWPVEVDSFLCELPLAVLRVFIRFILDHLHPFSSITLLMAVFTDHVQLPNPVLEDKTQQWVHKLSSDNGHLSVT